MMAAETYLRRRVEDDILDRRPDQDDHPRAADPAREAARALVVTGQLEAAVADRVLGLRRQARLLRSGATEWFDQQDDQSADGLPPRRVALCSGEVTVEESTIRPRWVSLRASDAVIAVTMSMSARHRRRPFWADPIQSLTVTDDRGTSTPTHFSGGGDGHEWHGTLHTERPLAIDTAWLDIEGTRFPLTDATAPVTTTIERFEDTPPAARAARYLTHLAAHQRFTHQATSLGAAADALIACGALPPDAPVIAETVGAANAAVPGLHPAAQFGTSRPRARRPVRPPAPVAAQLQLDDVAIAIDAVEPTADGFRAAVETTGPVEFDTDEDEDIPTGFAARLVFSATDDVGTSYSAHMDDYGGGRGNWQGTLVFDPALPPAATRLELIITSDTAQARITVPLAPA
jgi:hypothetical protein